MKRQKALAQKFSMCLRELKYVGMQLTKRLFTALLIVMVVKQPIMAQTDSSNGKENIKANLKTTDTTAPAVYKINVLSTAIIGVAATAANMIAINNVLHNKQNLTLEEIE
ncbi:MAG TPA: hypothetical protein VFL47_12165, partial [Flavisolibacter sp.]|nr:hypothetical protein [Flavisolibacter sp.]